MGNRKEGKEWTMSQKKEISILVLLWTGRDLGRSLILLDLCPIWHLAGDIHIFARMTELDSWKVMEENEQRRVLSLSGAV